MFSVALSGLSFVNALVPGVLRFAQAQAEFTPVCGLSHLDFVDLWFGAFHRTAIIFFFNVKTKYEAPEQHHSGCPKR